MKVPTVDEVFLVQFQSADVPLFSVRKLKSFEKRRFGKQTMSKSVKCRLAELEESFGLKKKKLRNRAVDSTRTGQAKHAVVTIQKLWRGYIVRKYFERLDDSLSLFQAHLRGWAIRRSGLYPKLRRENYASIYIQCFFRQIASRRCLQKKNHLKRLKLEAVLENKQNASLVIQTRFRGMQERIRFRNVHESVVKLQSLYRAKKDFEMFLIAFEVVKQRTENIVRIQRWIKRTRLKEEISTRVDLKNVLSLQYDFNRSSDSTVQQIELPKLEYNRIDWIIYGQ